MVLSPTVQRPRRANPSAAARSIRGQGRTAERRGVVRLGTRFEEGRAVERPRCAPDRGDEPVPHGPQQLPGECLGRQLGEHRIHGPKPDHEVVAVIAVAQHRVQTGQVRGMALARTTLAPPKGGADGGGIGRCGRGDGGAHGRSSLGAVSPGGNASGCPTTTQPTLHRIS